MEAPGQITTERRNAIVRAFLEAGGSCVWCGEPTSAEARQEFHLDRKKAPAFVCTGCYSRHHPLLHKLAGRTAACHYCGERPAIAPIGDSHQAFYHCFGCRKEVGRAVKKAGYTWLCRTCSKPAKRLCAQCRHVRYCSRACQKVDWPTHQKLCAMHPRKAAQFRWTDAKGVGTDCSAVYVKIDKLGWALVGRPAPPLLESTPRCSCCQRYGRIWGIVLDATPRRSPLCEVCTPTRGAIGEIALDAKCMACCSPIEAFPQIFAAEPGSYDVMVIYLVCRAAACKAALIAKMPLSQHT